MLIFVLFCFFFVILHVVNCNARYSLDVAFRHGLSAIWKRSRQMAIGQGQKMSSFEIIRAKLVSLAVTETRKFLFVESRLTAPNSVRLFFLPANRMMTSNKLGLLCSLSKGNNQEMKALISNSDSCLRTYVEFLNLMVFTVMWCKKKLKISQTMASVRNSPISFVINSHLNSQLPFIYLVLTVPINIYKVSCYII